MLTLFTLASIALGAQQSIQFIPAQADSITEQRQDTVHEEHSTTLLRNGAHQDKLVLRPFERVNTLSSLEYQHTFATILDSLLRTNPTLRNRLLKELLIPSDAISNDISLSLLAQFNRELEKDSKFTSFERMCLIAKRYAIYNSSDKSLKSYQLEIRRTIQWWLEEVLK